MYIGVSQANLAWLHYREGEWNQAHGLAVEAVSNWKATPYPFQWLAHWLLLAIARRQNRLPDAFAAARAMLDPNQQQLPDEVEDVLETVISAWEAGQVTAVQDHLGTAVEIAARFGFL